MIEDDDFTEGVGRGSGAKSIGRIDRKSWIARSGGHRERGGCRTAGTTSPWNHKLAVFNALWTLALT